MRRDRLLARFWSRINQASADECWPWQGPVDRQGYGRVNGSAYGHNLVHRVALQFSGVAVPPNKQVLHSCDNPRCCNPVHLRVGTNADNVADKVSRNRAKGLPGRLNPSAVLSHTQVAAIRRSYKRGSLQRELAEEYGVAQTTVSAIVRGETWRKESAKS